MVYDIQANHRQKDSPSVITANLRKSDESPKCQKEEERKVAIYEQPEQKPHINVILKQFNTDTDFSMVKSNKDHPTEPSFPEESEKELLNSIFPNQKPMTTCKYTALY